MELLSQAVNITPDSLNSLMINNKTLRLFTVNQAGEGTSGHDDEESVLADTGFHGFSSRNRKCSFTGTDSSEHVFNCTVGKGCLNISAHRY